MWTLTYSIQGQRHVQFVPLEKVELLEDLLKHSREYFDAMREIMGINSQLVSMWCKSPPKKKKVRKKQRKKK